MKKLLIFFLCIGAALAAARFTTPAFAHARLDSSAPSRGEILALAPAEVEIVFSQEIQNIAGSYDITVNKDRGSNVTTGPAVIDPRDSRKLSIPVKAGLVDGRYVVRWKNISDEDDDPAEGAFSFYINYQPNTIDLANDADLERVGESIETPPGETPASGTPAGGTPDAGTPTTPGEAPGQTPTASATMAAPVEDNDNASNTSFIVALAVAAVVALGALGFAITRIRR